MPIGRRASGRKNGYRHGAYRQDLSVVRDDEVYSGNYSFWGETEKTRWTPWFRSVAGLRMCSRSM